MTLITPVGKPTQPMSEMAQGLIKEPSQADVDLFASALITPATMATGALPALVAGALADRVHSTDKLSQTALRSMKSAATGEDSMDILQMSRSLSNYSLQMAVTTKVVNKTAQTIDKLTNLQ